MKTPLPKTVIRIDDKRGLPIGILDPDGRLWLDNVQPRQECPIPSARVRRDDIDIEALQFEVTGQYCYPRLTSIGQAAALAHILQHRYGIEFRYPMTDGLSLD